MRNRFREATDEKWKFIWKPTPKPLLEQLKTLPKIKGAMFLSLFTIRDRDKTAVHTNIQKIAKILTHPMTKKEIARKVDITEAQVTACLERMELKKTWLKLKGQGQRCRLYAKKNS